MELQFAQGHNLSKAVLTKVERLCLDCCVGGSTTPGSTICLRPCPQDAKRRPDAGGICAGPRMDDGRGTTR